MHRRVTFLVAALVSASVSACGSVSPDSASPDRGSVTSGGEARAPGARQPLRQAKDSIVLPVKPGEPCYAAERHSLKGLAALADVPVWLPHAQAASSSTFTGAWTCGGDIPLLTYGPVTISYESGYGTPLDWERKSRDWGAEVHTLLGEPGLLDPSSGADIKSQVMVVVEGDILVRILGEPSVAPEDLLAVANSIDLDEPVPG